MRGSLLGAIVALAGALGCQTPAATGPRAPDSPSPPSPGVALTGYAWSQPEGETWAMSGWEPIAGKRLAVLGLREEKTRCTTPEQPCLRREGGLLCHCITAVDERGGAIVAADALLRLVGAIDGAAKAADLVAVFERDLAEVDGRLVGHVRAVDGGWLVQAVRRNTFGCGNHEPTGFVLRVGNDGLRAVVAEQPAPPVDPARRICVD